MQVEKRAFFVLLEISDNSGYSSDNSYYDLDFLVELGADINFADEDVNTPFLLLRSDRHFSGVSTYDLKKLLDLGANVNYKNNENATVMSKVSNEELI